MKLHENVAILPNLHAVKQNRVKIDKTYWRSGDTVVSSVRGRMFGFVIFRVIFCVIYLKSITKHSIWMQAFWAEQVFLKFDIVIINN